MKYRPEIDGLRALAVVPVILFHAGFEWFGGGFIGVDIFFVISGYLITNIIVSEMEANKFSLLGFYERRARRILPALFFVMLICIPFALIWFTPNDLKDFGKSLVAVSTFSSNILFWLESGYFSTDSSIKPLLHTWSLAVEEQYYIFYPLFLILVWKMGIKKILILLFVIFLISLTFAHWGAYNSPQANFYLIITRAWEILLGVFVAFYLKDKAIKKSNLNFEALSILGFVMILLSIIFFDETTPFPSFYALIPTIGTVLLISCTTPNTLMYRFFTIKPIVGIGLISYSAYLWHQPIFAFSNYRFLGSISNYVLLIFCVISFLLAWFSWKFIEKPFRDKSKFSRNQIFKLSLISILIFSSLGLAINFNKIIGYDNDDLHAEWDEGVLCSYPTSGYKDLLCEKDLKITNNKSVLIIGDSLLNASLSGLQDAANKSNILLDAAPNWGCPALYRTTRINNGIIDKLCLKYNKKMFEEFLVTYKKRYDLVIFFSAFNGYLHNGKATFTEPSPCDAKMNCNESFKKSIQKTINYMNELEIKYIFIEQFPRYEIVGSNLDPARWKKFGKPIQMLRSKHEDDSSLFFEIMEQNNAKFISTANEFCNKTKCSPYLGEEIIYINAAHVSQKGSIYLSKFWQKIFNENLNSIN
ncbi:acyltransferase [Gammaproteobacteria bacterium]|nr:acyltransferase [Gammaproteobacteria bacterium]